MKADSLCVAISMSKTEGKNKLLHALAGRATDPADNRIG
jgi:hypothetical protein